MRRGRWTVTAALTPLLAAAVFLWTRVPPNQVRMYYHRSPPGAVLVAHSDAEKNVEAARRVMAEVG